MERLIRRRRECPELGWGPFRLLDAGHPAVLCHRVDWEGSTVLALHSFAGERLEAAVGVEPEVDEAVDLFDGEDATPRDGKLSVPLDPYGARWFRVRPPGSRLPP